MSQAGQHQSSHDYTSHIKSFDVIKISSSIIITNDSATSAWPASVKTKHKETITRSLTLLESASEFIIWSFKETEKWFCDIERTCLKSWCQRVELKKRRQKLKHSFVISVWACELKGIHYIWTWKKLKTQAGKALLDLEQTRSDWKICELKTDISERSSSSFHTEK